MPGLKRDSTMPTRRPRPCVLAGMRRIGMVVRRRRRGGAMRGTLRRLARRGLLDVAGDLEVEAGHARHLARLGEQPHPADVEVAQDLRADAVVAQVDLRRRPAARRRARGGAARARSPAGAAARRRRGRPRRSPRAPRRCSTSATCRPRRAGPSPTAARARAPASRCPGDTGPRTSARCVASESLSR